MNWDEFRQVWLVDFEFTCPPGERPMPLCLVGREFRSGKLLKVWFDESTAPQQCPIPTGPDVLFIAYYASAELGCYLALGWPLPSRIMDLYCEFRNLTNGRATSCGSSLLGALTWFGLDAIEAAEKQELRELAMRGGPYTQAEQVSLLDYCQTDVDGIARLLPKILTTINVDHALIRGRYMAAVACMERNGVPIDAGKLALMREHWPEIQNRLIASVDFDYGVFDGRTFKADRWAAYLKAKDIPWPRLPSGRWPSTMRFFGKWRNAFRRRWGRSANYATP